MMADYTHNCPSLADFVSDSDLGVRRRTGTELEYFLRVFWVPAAAFVAAEAVTVITSSRI